MKKKQVNIRASKETQRKLKELTERFGTQTEVIAVAIDRLYLDVINGKVKADEQSN